MDDHASVGRSEIFLRISESIRLVVARYAHHISVGAFLLGFIFDSIALPRIDHPAAQWILVCYLALAGLGILCTQLFESAWISETLIRRFSPITALLPGLIQFIFGGLFSALFVYYFRSASLAGSWPFFILLAVMIIGNELFRDRFKRLEFQVSVLFTTLFGFMTFYLPILFHRLDASLFLAGGIASLIGIFLFLIGLFVVAPNALYQSGRTMLMSVSGIFVLFNILYFTNSIPPIPLALQSAGVYHSLYAGEGVYVGQAEHQSWYERYVALAPKYHHRRGEAIYFYSAVFAPTALTQPIYHEWQYFDEIQDKWVASTRVMFPIVGGREHGYRGYSSKSAITEGKWRVEVGTLRGQLLGKTTFTVVFVDAPVFLEERVL